MELDEPSTSSKKRNKISSKESGNDDDNSINWTSLPNEVFLRIFSHLPDGDLYNAMLACQSWNSLCHIPELWRERSYHFVFSNDPNVMTNPTAGALFMANLGVHLRSLDAYFDFRSDIQGFPTLEEGFSFTEHFFETVKLFFSTIPPGINLEQFSLWNLGVTRENSYIELLREFPEVISYFRRKRNELIAVLCSFLQKQYGLEHVFFRFCDLKMKPALKLLNALTPTQAYKKNQRADLFSLVIDDFFAAGEPVAESPKFLKILSEMRQLNWLVINIEYLSDRSLQVLADNLNLETLKLACYDDKVRPMQFGSLTSTGWEYLVDQLPELQVTVQLREIVSTASLRAILIQRMPLTEIDILFDIDDYDNTIYQSVQDFRLTFNSLFIELIGILSRWFRNSLESFYMRGNEVRPTTEHFSELEEGVLRMSQAMPKLAKISLPIDLSENFQQQMFEERPDIKLSYMGHGHKQFNWL